jgi:hypothetical protein
MIVVLPKSERIHASYLSNLYWYFPWFHELSFPWYRFENPIEPVEPVSISKDRWIKDMWKIHHIELPDFVWIGSIHTTF